MITALATLAYGPTSSSLVPGISQFSQIARSRKGPSTLRALKRVIKNSKHPAWLGAVRFAAEYAYGKPTQDLTLTAKMSLEELVAKANEPNRVEKAEVAEVISIEPVKQLAGSHALRALPRGAE